MITTGPKLLILSFTAVSSVDPHLFSPFVSGPSGFRRLPLRYNRGSSPFWPLKLVASPPSSTCHRPARSRAIAAGAGSSTSGSGDPPCSSLIASPMAQDSVFRRIGLRSVGSMVWDWSCTRARLFVVSERRIRSWLNLCWQIWATLKQLDLSAFVVTLKTLDFRWFRFTRLLVCFPAASQAS